MQKRGQITVFIIVGIIFLFISAGVIYLVSSLQKEELANEWEELPEIVLLRSQITSFVESCLQETALPGIYLLGIQGGIIYPQDLDKVLLTESAIINYASLNGVDQLSVGAMEEELDSYIEDNLQYCINEFSAFTEQGFSIDSGKIKSESKIAMDKVILDISYEVKVTQDDNDQLLIKSFSDVVPLPVGKVIQEAKEIANFGGPLITKQSQYFISIFPFDSFTIIYSISDENSVIDGAPFTFMFAVKNSEINSPPELEYIPNLVVRRDENLIYQLRAKDPENNILSYTVEPRLFTISQNGFINQKIEELGENIITITVEDIHGLQDQQEVRLVVIDA